MNRTMLRRGYALRDLFIGIALCGVLLGVVLPLIQTSARSSTPSGVQ